MVAVRSHQTFRIVQEGAQTLMTLEKLLNEQKARTGQAAKLALNLKLAEAALQSGQKLQSSLKTAQVQLKDVQD
jgi:hypothetical protein